MFLLFPNCPILPIHKQVCKLLLSRKMKKRIYYFLLLFFVCQVLGMPFPPAFIIPYKASFFFSVMICLNVLFTCYLLAFLFFTLRGTHHHKHPSIFCVIILSWQYQEYNPCYFFPKSFPRNPVPF